MQRPLEGLVDVVWRDVRHAARALATHRTATALSILCLAVGIGANTSIFTFVNALLLRPVPLAATDRLMIVQEVRRQDRRSPGPVSQPNFVDWQTNGAGVGELAAQRAIDARVTGDGDPQRYAGALVTANFFSLLGVPVARGRGFFAHEDRPGGAPVVLLSHALWQERYDSNPAIIGRSITVNGVARTVVGVMPEELSSIALRRIFRGARLWMPLGSVEPGGRGDRRLVVFARLAPGLTREGALAQLDVVARTLERTYPVENGGWAVSVQPLRVGFSERTRGLMLLLMGAVAFVLLIVCANVANLTLARAITRRAEIATRLALGASRRRIVGQLLTESLLIACASVAGGIAIAHWARGLLAGSNASPAQLAELTIGAPVLLFTIGLADVTSVLSGLLPTLHVVRRVRCHGLNIRQSADMSAPSHRPPEPHSDRWGSRAGADAAGGGVALRPELRKPPLGRRRFRHVAHSHAQRGNHDRRR